MPNIQSAKKRVRQDRRRTARNRVRKERLRKALKAFHAVLASGDENAIREELPKVQKAVDKAGVKGVLHPNAVDRKKSRLSRAAQRAMTPSA